MTDPGLRGLTGVYLTTDDAQPHLRLYKDLLGFEVLRADVLPSEQVQGVWGLDKGIAISAVRLGVLGTESGFIDVLVLGGAALPEAIRPHVLDAGIFDFDVATWNVASTYEDLVKEGYEWSCPPQLWTAEAFGNIDIEEGLCRAPDGVNLVFPRPFQNKGSAAWALDPNRRYSEMYSSVYVVEDLQREIDFWGPDGMGLRVGADVPLDHPGARRFIGIEEDAGLRMVLMTARGSGPARVEIISPQTLPCRADFTRRQRPGRWRGISGWNVKVQSLDAALDAVRRKEGEILSGAIELDSPILGRVTSAAVATPCGVFVELYQPAD